MSRRGAVLERVDFDPMPLQSQLQASELGQRNYEFQQQMAAQKHRQQQLDKDKNKKESLDFIGGLGLDHIGDNTIDILTDKQIQSLQGKLMDMQASGADISDIKMEAQRQLPAIVNGHTIAKNKYDQIKSGLTELGKDYPTGDLNKARELAVVPMLKDVLKFDDKGNAIGYNDPSVIPEKNYISPLLNDENVTQWYKPSGGLEAHIKSLPLSKIGDSKKVRNSRGVEMDNIWEGMGSAFSRLKTDPTTGAVTGQEIKYESIPIGTKEDGTPNIVNVLPKEEFDLLTGTPTAKADFTLKFNKHLQDIGVNPQSLDPRAKDILQRQYAHDWLTETNIDGHTFIPKQSEKQPLPPRVSVRVNNGSSKNSEDTQIRDVYKEINNKYISGVPEFGADYRIPLNELSATAQVVILDYANKISKNEDDELGKFTQKDIYIDKSDDGRFNIKSAADQKLIAPIDFTDVNIKVQPNTKAKAEVVEQGNNRKPTVSKKTFDIVDPNTGKIVMSGVDENSANKAKSKGYKIQ